MNRRLISQIFFYCSFTIELILSSHCYGSFEGLTCGANALAMGNTSSVIMNSPDAIFMNCSGLACMNELRMSIYYSNPYGLKELMLGSFAVIAPTSFGNFGIAVKSFGNKLYQENECYFSYANSQFQHLYYGVALRYSRLEIEKYGTDYSFCFNFGFIAVISPKVRWGFYSHNINQADISSKKETLPQIYATGVQIDPVENLLLNFEIYKDLNFPIEYRFGADYELFNRLTLRSGFVTEPALFSAGFGVTFPFMTIDYAFQSQGDLGFTHHFSMILSLKKSKITKTETKFQIVNSRVNINTADEDELKTLKGIGNSLAKRIIQYRIEHGPFRSLDELKNVKGIGDRIIENNKDIIILE